MHYTTVKHMIDDMVTPVLKTIPTLKKDMNNLSKNFTTVQGQVKKQHKEIDQFGQEIKQIHSFHMTLERQKQNAEYETQRVND
mmetsp:Transcript_42479/g.65141  ORF Transcript_42479/g.65141 Transcript_42479/m.65141 type:complete len:83 (-) Transcript_42479:13-261(-)